MQQKTDIFSVDLGLDIALFYRKRGSNGGKMKPKELKLLIPGFVPFSEQNIQGHLKDFQGHISHFSRTTFSAKREP